MNQKLPKLPPRPENPTPLQQAFHDYIRGLITYGAFKQALDKHIAARPVSVALNQENL